MGRPFTAVEDRYIARQCSKQTLAAIGAHLGRSWGTVQGRRNLLARKGILDRRKFRRRPWTGADEEVLGDLWGDLPDRVVAKRLNRSVNACYIRAERHLRINRRMAFWTAWDVARLFGVDSHVAIRWINAGVLKGEKSHVRCGDGNIVWRIEAEAIEAFIRAYPYHYDRNRIESPSKFRALAEQVWQRDPWLTTVETARELGIRPNTCSGYLAKGRLPAVKTWCAGKFGAWRVAMSEVRRFKGDEVR